MKVLKGVNDIAFHQVSSLLPAYMASAYVMLVPFHEHFEDFFWGLPTYCKVRETPASVSYLRETLEGGAQPQ